MLRHPSFEAPSSLVMNDEAVIATNDDATECKRGAVRLGYWDDPYVGHLAKGAQRRAPEINRGYFARVRGVERFIEKFLSKAGDEGQIINLGAGFDTLYWRLKDREVKLKGFVEIDFPSVTSKKCYLIKRNKELLKRIHEKDQEVRLSPTDLHAGPYHCIGTDLRNLIELESKLKEAEIDFSSPTLFISECVLVYIEPDSTDRLLKWIKSKFSTVISIVYEMCNVHDTFGKIMIENLRARGCTLAGIASCKDLETQRNRFESNGWDGAKAWDMVEVYRSIDSSERERVEKLEFLDERELLDQLFQHYCICVGWIGTRFDDCDLD